MKYYGMTEAGKHLGVAGLGGLGHVAVKIGKAFGLKVTVISSSSTKAEEAINHLGADSFLVTTDPQKMKVTRVILNLVQSGSVQKVKRVTLTWFCFVWKT